MKGIESMNTRISVKDPGSALTHFIGILLSVFGTILLIYFSIREGTLWHVLSFSIYGISLILLYTASTIYHTIDISPKVTKILRKIDHMMIFVLIAGTYTPICLVILQGALGVGMLIFIWAFALVGIFIKAFWMNAPRWISTLLYVLMGWIAVFAILPLWRALPIGAILWLVAGGLLYTLGAVIYGVKRPELPFRNFGFHEVFHVFVLAGSLCHYVVMFRYILWVS